MIDHLESNISQLYMRKIEQQENGTTSPFGNLISGIQNADIQNALKKLFFTKFKEPEFFNFSAQDGDTNQLKQICDSLFTDPHTLDEKSTEIANLLISNSEGQNIKSGDLLMAYVRDAVVEDEMIDAICIFKINQRSPFLIVDEQESQYQLSVLAGIDPSKIDKACIVFNTDAEDGYKICLLDTVAKEGHAHYWKSDFLQVTPIGNDYQQTKHFIQATKVFLKANSDNIDKPTESKILQNSLSFLQNEETFDTDQFIEEVFPDKSMGQEFSNYKSEYARENKLPIGDNFSINKAAVSNQSKVFRSVLKLDKNFHIYIHGDRNKIERGVDDFGRKYYKLFYEEER